MAITKKFHALSLKGILLLMMLVYAHSARAVIEISAYTHATSGQCDGSIEVTATGSAGPFDIVITSTTNNSVVYDISEIYGTHLVTNLCPDSYSISVINAYSCSRVLVQEIIVCQEIAINSPNIYNPTSCTSNDGDIVIASHGSYPQGGIPPYTYQWSTGQETANIYELGAGTYILTITDSEGCAQAFTFNLAPEGSPQIALVGEIMKSCEGEDNGAIEITFYIQNGGLSHYIVRWYNDSGELVSEQDIDNGFDSSISGLPPGNYTAIVEADEDNNPNTTGCSSSATFFVEERLSLGPFIATPQITPTCYGDNTGRIALNASGGNPPYTYNWDNGEHTQSIHSLPSPASYSVTVTDDCGRQIAHNNLFVPSYAEITHAIVSEGGCPGMIELETSGGTPPYNYLWSDGQTGAAAAGLVNGAAYQVTVSDANGCSVVQSFAVPVDEEDAFEILISSLAAPFTQNTTDGAVVVTTDPAGTYSYLWSNGAAGASVEGLSPGNYSVTATNTAGCSVARTVSLQSCYIFPGLIPNLPDFEILATGGLFSNAADGETTLSALIKEEGETFFTEDIPNGYSIRWEFSNGNVIGNAPSLTVSLATVLANRPNFSQTGWATVSLIVSNGCVEKKIGHHLIICGQVEEQFADFVLTSFFIQESEVVHPCSGLSDGSIAIEIPNPEGLDISVIRDGIVLPTLDAPGFSVVQETGLSAGTYNFEIAIGHCVNSFAFQLNSQSTSLNFQTYNSSAGKCVYEESCREIPLGNYEETAFWDYDNATNTPCEIPILCGDDVVDGKRFSKRTVRGFEYKLILQQLLNSEFSPFDNEEYIVPLIREAARIDNCDRIMYCPATMEKTSSILASLANDRGVENSGNGCFRVNCSGIFGIGFHFDVCAHDLNVPDDLFLDEFDPGTNTCLPEQANLFELYHAWQELGAFSDVTDFHETALHAILLQFGNTPEAKCATIIYCVNDLYQILYSDVESVECVEFHYENPRFFPAPGDPQASINSCEPPIYVSLDPEENITYEVVYCYEDGNIREHVIDYGYFPPSPEGGRPSDIIIDKFDLDTFYIEKLASLGFVKNEGRIVPKPIISTDYGQSIYYDYNHKGKVLSKRKLRNTAYHIDDWDADQALFCFINEASKEYEIAYFDSLSEWSHLLRSDGALHVSHFSRDEHTITVAGTWSGTLWYDETTITEGEAEQNTLFIATIDRSGQFIQLNTITGSHSGFAVSKNIGGRLAIGGKYGADGLAINGIPVSLPSSEGIFLATYSASSGIGQPGVFLSGQDGLQLIKLSQDSSFDNFTAVIKASGGNNIDINGQISTLPEGAAYFALNFSEEALNWIFPITSDGFDETNFDIVHGKEQSVFIGITFENSLSIAEETITSQGGRDIAIVKLDGLSGAVDRYHAYGSAGDESVMELIYDEFTLFFAGELTGPETYREIGNYNFYNPVPSDSSKVYLSYLFDLDDPTANRPQPLASPAAGITMKREMDLVRIEKVFPNPFAGSFNLILNSEAECESEILLFNIIGEKVCSRVFEFSPGENRASYEVPDDVPDGIYYLQAKANGMKSNSCKLIRIHK